MPTRGHVGACLLLFVSAMGSVVASCAASESPPPETATSSTDPVTTGPWMPGQPDFAARRASGQAEIGEALRALDVAGSACGDACPALATLRVGVVHLCGVADTKDDQKICKESRASLATSEARLRADCGACKPAPDADTDTDGGFGPPL